MVRCVCLGGGVGVGSWVWRGGCGETQLLSAVRDGDIATVRRLVTEGHVDVNVTDEVGVSSLSCC